ncbi:MAG: ATP-binding protein [Nitrospira sp.]|nr:ATP-binding protein [Nitrospira sp.]
MPMRSFHRHIRRAALFLMLGLIFTFGILLYAGLSIVLHRHVDQELLATAQAEARQVEVATGVLREFGGSGDDDDADERLIREAARSVVVLSPDGTAVWTGAAVAKRPGLAQAMIGRTLQGEVVYDTISTGSGSQVRRILFPIQRDRDVRYILQTEASLRVVRESLQMLLGLLGAVVLLGLGAAWLGSGWLARETLLPVEALSRTAEQITSPPLDIRAPVDAPYVEFQRLAHVFNAMLDRLHKVFESQRRFVADAAHELKTPLTAIRGNLEVALQRARSAEEYRDSMLTLLGEVERLIALTHSLLTLAQLSGERTAMEMKPLALEPIARNVIGDLDVLAQDRAITLSLAVGPVPMVLGEAGRLKQVLINLLDNALRHTPAQGKIAVTLAATASIVRITVSDTGPGIAPELLPHLFEPFYRADRARAKEDGGTGLGLAIVKEIVEAHGGEVRVESEVGKGAVFTLLLPVIGCPSSMPLPETV